MTQRIRSLAALLLMLLPCLAAGQTLHDSVQPEAAYQITTNDAGIVLTEPKGRVITIAWKDLRQVVVRTTDEGPLRATFYWQLLADKKTPTIVFPQGATGELSFLKVIQRRLPGFNNRELVRASGSTANALFVLWTAPAAAP